MRSTAVNKHVKVRSVTSLLITSDYIQIDPVVQEHVELKLGDAIETTFEITVVAGAPPGKYDFDIHILDVKRGTDNRSIADNIQFEPETALLRRSCR